MNIQNTFIEENFKTNERRKVIDTFCRNSPMYDVITKRIDKRHLLDKNDHWLADFSTQDYLGWGFEPRQIQAAIKATKDYGTVIAWCRLVATVDLVEQAEIEIAKLVGTEAASIFASTTLLNHGVIPALVGNDGLMLLDKSAHATMYEGCKIARDSGAKLVSFAQDDFETLEKLLIENKNIKKKLILVDGVYSMTGDYANLIILDELAKKHDALIYVDDAHGFGVVGENPDSAHPYGHRGNGLVKFFNRSYDNILYIGCFSKAYGTFGAFIACSKNMQKFILSQATPHDLGGAGPASALAALLEGLKLNNEIGDERRQKMFRLTNIANKGLKELGFTVTNTTMFPILYVKTGNDKNMIEISKILYDNHILLTLSPYPMVKRGEEGLRVTITATNTEEEVKQLLQAFAKVKEYLNK